MSDDERREAAAREAKMRAVLEKWERSGLALSRFAEREGIGRKTLYRWRRRLGVGGDQSAVAGDRCVWQRKASRRAVGVDLHRGELGVACGVGRDI